MLQYFTCCWLSGPRQTHCISAPDYSTAGHGSDESMSTQNENNSSAQTVGGEDPDLSCLKKSPVPFSGAEERLDQRIVGSMDIFSDAAIPV